MYVCVCLLSMEAKRGCWLSLELELQSCELPFNYWKLNPGPLQEQQVLSPFSSCFCPIYYNEAHKIAAKVYISSYDFHGLLSWEKLEVSRVA